MLLIAGGLIRLRLLLRRPASVRALLRRIDVLWDVLRGVCLLDASLLFDLTGRGAVILAGKDRASFLHGLVTNDIKKLTPGTGCAAAFLTPKGKLLADCVVLCDENRLEIDCEPELAGKIEDLLRKYLVFNEVECEVMARVKAAFDPANMLNPDKILPIKQAAVGMGV